MKAYFDRIIDGQPIYESDGIKYLQPLRATGEPVYEVNLSKLDKVWGIPSNPFYIRFIGSISKGKIPRIKDILSCNAPIDMSEIYISKSGEFSFSDGRHRYFVLKEMRKRTIIVTVSPASDFSHIHRIDGRKLA